MTTPTDPDFMRIVDQAVEAFDGDLGELERAIGMLMLGRQYGWKVLMLIHSQATVRKYTRILGLRHLKDVLPDVGPLAGRSRAWRLVDGTRTFWQVVRGQVAGIRSTEAAKGPVERG